MIALEELNRLTPEQFVAALSGIFEHSDWIADRAYAARPFSSRLQLLEVLRGVVRAASTDEQLALIGAHPKLGQRGRARAQLTQASSSEQKRAGLDACSDEQLVQLQHINASYEARFGFPFILAVRGHQPLSIIAQMQRRVLHDRSVEVRTALHQIGLIAAYRLADVVASTATAELPAMQVEFACGDRRVLLIEWLRAAGLSVWDDESGALLGAYQDATAGAVTVLLGIHADSTTGQCRQGGAYEVLEATAIVQQIKTRAAEPIDLAVFCARRALEVPARDTPPGLGLPMSRVGLESLGASAATVLRLLTQAGRTASDVNIVTRSTEPKSMPADIGRVWQDFLLHTSKEGSREHDQRC